MIFYKESKSKKKYIFFWGGGEVGWGGGGLELLNFYFTKNLYK